MTRDYLRRESPVLGLMEAQFSQREDDILSMLVGTQPSQNAKVGCTYPASNLNELQHTQCNEPRR